MTKELEVDFYKKKEHFVQKEKSEKYYIYERTISGGNAKCYEIFKRRSVKIADYIRQYDTTGKYEGFDRMEIYPGNENFGVWAYCCVTLEQAKTHCEHFNNSK